MAAHAHGGPGLTTAARAGIRTIEHAAVASDDEVQAMLDAGCWLVATFTILFHPDGIERGDGGNLILRNLELAASASRTNGAHPGLGSAPRARHRQHARAMAYEVQTAVRFGVSPLGAVLAAAARVRRPSTSSRGPARSRPGKDADLIALDGNPSRISARSNASSSS